MGKVKNFTSEGFSLDNELDIPDFNDPFEPKEDNRKPVTKFTFGAISGTRSTLADSAFIENSIKELLPTGYGKGIDFTKEANESLKKLYNSAAEQSKPMLSTIGRALDKVVPESAKRTKAFIEKLKGLEEKEGDFYSEREGSDSNINKNLETIFGASAAETMRRQDRAESRERVRDVLEADRHKMSFGALNTIAVGTQALVQYQNKITAAYQKKSLELQYRHYFLAKEQMEIMRKNNEKTLKYLDGIAKNTGLPDTFKYTTKERLYQGLLGGRSQIAKRMMDGIIQTIGEKLEGVGGVHDELKDARERLKDTGEDFTTYTGQALGGMALQEISSWFINKHKDKVLDSKLSKKLGIRKHGEKLEMGIGNIAQHLKRLKSDPRSHEVEGLKGILLRLGQDLIPSFGFDNSLDRGKTSKENVLGQYVFTRQASTSIIEVIPGFLSRILRELQVIRTGDNKTELVEYDYTKSKFTNTSGLRSSIIKQLIPKSNQIVHKYDLSRVFKLIDPNNTLTDDQKNELGRKLTELNIENELGDSKLFTNENTFSGLKSGSVYLNLFKDYYNKDGTIPNSQEYTEKENKLNKVFNELGTSIGDITKTVESIIDLGYQNVLIKLGVITKDLRKINVRTFLDAYHGGKLRNILSQPPDSEESSKAPTSLNTKEVYRRTSKNTYKSTTINNSSFDFTGMSSKLEQLYNDNREYQIESNKELTNNFNNVITKLDLINESIKTGIAVNIQTTTGGTTNSDSNVMYKLFGSGWTAAKSVFKVAGKAHNLLAKAGWTTAKFVGGKALGVASALAGVGKRAIDSFKDKDIYIKDKLEPAIIHSKLVLGEYRDAITGKVLKTVEEVKECTNDIIDSSGNIALSVKDKANTYVKIIKNNKLIRKALNWTTKALVWGFNTSMSMQRNLFNIARNIGTTIRDKINDRLDRPRDIYVKGETSPRMLAFLIEQGEYYSQKTHSKISKMSDIDGTIYRLESGIPKIVLTEEDIKKGLVDSSGNPIILKRLSITGILTRGAMAAGSMAFNLASRVVNWGINATTSGWKAGEDMFDGFLGAITGGIGGKRGLNLLEKIYTLLDERVPKKKTVLGDEDGDGIREGSYKDQAKEDKENITTDKDGNKIDKRKKGILSKAKDKILGLFGKKDKDKEKNKDDEEKSSGVWDTIKGYLGGKAALWLGGKAATIFGGGAVAGTAAAGTAAAGTAAAGTAAAGTAAAGAAASGGIASALAVAAPWIIGGLVVAGIGVGVYYGGRYLIRKSKSKNAPAFTNFRLAQYGIDVKEKNAEFAADKVLELESLLLEQLEWAGSVPQISISKVNKQKLLNIIGGNSTETYVAFTKWFNTRMKPVLTTWVSAVYNGLEKDGRKDLRELRFDEMISEMKPESQKALIPNLRFADGPYDVEVGFITAFKSTANGNTVSKYYDELVKAYANASNTKTALDTRLGVSEVDKKNAAALQNTTIAVVSGVASTNLAKSENINKNIIKTSLKSSNSHLTHSEKLAAAGALSSMSAYNALHTEGMYSTSINALDALRFKAYGLTKMDMSKVSNIRLLETSISPLIMFVGEKTSANVDPFIVLRELGGRFGITNTDSPEAKIWLMWFNNRFLPIYTGYRSLLRKFTGKDDQKSGALVVKSSHMLLIAEDIIANTKWNELATPWTGYEVNKDSTSVNDNLEYIKQKAKDEELHEEKAISDKEKADPNKATRDMVDNKTTGGEGGSGGDKGGDTGKQAKADTPTNKPNIPVSTNGSEAPINKFFNNIGNKVKNWWNGSDSAGATASGASGNYSSNTMLGTLGGHASEYTGKISYKMGAKNLSSGSIDCSGWIEAINKDALKKEPKGNIISRRIFDGNGAAGITKNLVDTGANVITKGALNPNTITEGMIIGESNGGSWARGRFQGIDHITQVVKDPTSGKLMISQSQGRKGVTLTDPETYFRGKYSSSKNTGLFGIDIKDAYGRIAGDSGAFKASSAAPTSYPGTVSSTNVASTSTEVRSGGQLGGDTGKQGDKGTGNANIVKTSTKLGSLGGGAQAIQTTQTSGKPNTYASLGGYAGSASANPTQANQPGKAQSGKGGVGVVTLSGKDVKDLIKVTSTEVVKSLPEEQFKQQAAGVIDTILNRVASRKWGSTMQDVVNASHQFSAISGNKKAYGSVDRMPDSAIDQKTAEFTKQYLAQRVAGKPSIIGGHLNYANPHYSDSKNLKWINQLKADYNIVIGSGKAIHYHGTVPELKRYMPGAFKLVVSSYELPPPSAAGEVGGVGGSSGGDMSSGIGSSGGAMGGSGGSSGFTATGPGYINTSYTNSDLSTNLTALAGGGTGGSGGSISTSSSGGNVTATQAFNSSVSSKANPLVNTSMSMVNDTNKSFTKQEPRAEMDKAFGSFTDIAKKQLDVQTNIYATIKEIKNFMANKANDVFEKVDENPEPIKGTEKPTRKKWTEKKPKGPISVES